jgi:hypothetical protein
MPKDAIGLHGGWRRSRASLSLIVGARPLSLLTAKY